MLRTFNKIVSKSISKMNLNSRLNAKSKKYLKIKGIGRHYNETFKNILVVLEEKEEETYLKVLLINEFCRFSLNYVHLCSSEKEENSVFDNFYLLVIYLCRIIKKFYAKKLQKIINERLKVICSGFELYTNIFCCRGGKYKAKVDQMNGLMTLVDETFNYRGKKEPN